MRKRELEARIEKLERQVYELKMEKALFESKWKEDVRNMIEGSIKERIRVTVVENLAAYEIGKKLKEPIKKIEEVL